MTWGDEDLSLHLENEGGVMSNAQSGDCSGHLLSTYYMPNCAGPSCPSLFFLSYCFCLSLLSLPCFSPSLLSPSPSSPFSFSLLPLYHHNYHLLNTYYMPGPLQ